MEPIRVPVQQLCDTNRPPEPCLSPIRLALSHKVKSEVFCRLPFLRVVGSCSCWLRGQLAEGVARSELAPQAATAGGSVTGGGLSSPPRDVLSPQSRVVSLQ